MRRTAKAKSSAPLRDRVNLKSLAKHLGVSAMTVSRRLNRGLHHLTEALADLRPENKDEG